MGSLAAVCTGSAQPATCACRAQKLAPRQSAGVSPLPAAAFGAAARRCRPQLLQHGRGLTVAAAAATSTAAQVQELNKKFGIPGHVEVKEGLGGLPTVVLRHACGASAEVTLFGGCITSFKQASGDEVLFMRPDAVFDKSKPISGGIPHCFPQFGPGPIQQHGFARNVDWEIAATSADPQPDDRDPEVQLVLTDTDFTRAMWPHAFRAVYSVALHGELLRTDLRVLNTGDAPFSFTAALHSYIEVLDVEKAAVRGLKGLEYLDKVPDPKSPVKKREEREAVTFSGPTDSVYLKAKDYVQLDVGTGAAVGITSNRWSDVVVWSPWDTLPGYRSFVCVENAQFGEAVTLQPKEHWRAQMEMAVLDL